MLIVLFLNLSVSSCLHFLSHEARQLYCLLKWKAVPPEERLPGSYARFGLRSTQAKRHKEEVHRVRHVQQGKSTLAFEEEKEGNWQEGKELEFEYRFFGYAQQVT